MANGLKRTIEIVIRANNKVGPVLKKLAKGIGTFAKKAGKLLGGLAKRVKRLGLVFIGLAAAIATKAVKSFMTFDEVMRNVWTLIPIGEQAFRDLSDAVLQMSRDLPKTPEDLGASLYDIISAGITDTAQALMVLGQSAKAAVAGVTDVATASAPAIAIMNAYGKSAAAIPDIFDLLFSTIRVGVLRFGELQNAVGTMVSTFASAEAPMSEMLGALAFLTKNGLNAARSATALNRAIGVMVARRKEFERILGVKVFNRGKWRGLVSVVKDLADKLDGMTTEQKLAKIQLLVPQLRARKALVAMINNYEEFGRVVGEVEDRHGALNKAAARQLDSLSSKWQLLKNGISEVFIRIGEVLGVFLGPLFQKAQKRVNGLADAIDKNREKLLLVIRDLTTRFTLGIAKVFNFIAGVIDGATTAVVNFNIALKQMALLFGRIERNKLGIPTLRELTPDEAVRKSMLEFVQMGIRDFGTLQKFIENTNLRIDRLGKGVEKLQKIGAEVPQEVISQIETLQAVVNFANKEFGLLAEVKTPRIDLSALLNQLNNFFNGIADREKEIRAQAEKPIKITMSAEESFRVLESELKEIDRLLRLSTMSPFRRGVAGAAEGLGNFFTGLARGAIALGNQIANTLKTGIENVGGFLGKFYKEQAKELASTIAGKVIPTAALFLQAIEAEDPDAIIDKWVKGAIGFVRSLARNMGVVIDALIEAVPDLLVAIAEGIPQIIVALAEKLPDLAILFVEVLLIHAPRIAFAIAEGLVRSIGILLLIVLDKVLGGLLRALGFDPRKAIEELSAGAGSTTQSVFGEAQPLQDGGFVRRGGLFNLHENETVIPAGGAPVKLEVHIHNFVPSGMDRRTIRNIAREIKEETETIIDARFKE